MSNADKKRINEYLQEYWEKLRAGRPYPRESEVAIEDLAPIWESCFLVRVDPQRNGGHGYTYIFLGKSLIEAYGDEYSEKEVCEKLVYPSNMLLVHKFDEVLKTGKPVVEDAEFVNQSKMLIKYRSNMLPLGDADDQIRFIVGGMKWKAY